MSCTASRRDVRGCAGLPSVAKVSDQQHSDGWEALRARLEASDDRSWFRGGWIPRVRRAGIPPDPSATAERGLPAADADADADSGAGSGAEAEGQPARRGAPPALPAPPVLTRSHLAVVVVVAVVAVLLTVLVVRSAQPSEQSVPLAAHAALDATPTATPTLPPAGSSADEPPTDEPETGPHEAEEVVVHVAGKVRRPGVVRLPAGSRVIDAVEAAGGARPNADLSAVNLARELQDGEQVRVGIPPDPAVDVVAAGTPGEGGGMPSGGALDLNSATATELESLPGIGPVLAQRIVSYRDQSGPFRTVEQLVEVAGIGPAVMASVADLVRV